MQKTVELISENSLAEQYLEHQDEYSQWMEKLIKPRPFQSVDEESSN